MEVSPWDVVEDVMEVALAPVRLGEKYHQQVDSQRSQHASEKQPCCEWGCDYHGRLTGSP
jgi:hypothetical protein